MKKILLTTVAAGALALCGAASAQDLGEVIANQVLSNVLGTNVLGYGVPYSAHDTIQGSYRDEYGRLWVIDGAGRHTMVAPGTEYGGVVGAPLAYNTNRYYRDSDGDGVVDARDRRPYDARRW